MHRQIHLESSSPHLCQSCGLEFRSLSKLNYHIVTSHSIHGLTEINNHRYEVNESQIKYSCGLCPRTFPTLSHLRMHEMVHTASPGSSSLNQPINNSGVFVSAVNVGIGNSQNDISGQMFVCDRCPANFRYRTLLERHKRMHVVGQDKPYSCPRCLMRFDTRNLYNHHAKTHKPSVAGNAQIAGNIAGLTTVSLNNQSSSSSGAGAAAAAAASSTSSNINLNLSNKNPANYTCETCSKQFLTIESLTSHKSVHRSRPLVCDVCGKGFTHRKYYVVHQRIHTGERPYLCAMCGKSFTQASTLTVHRRYHTGERPYTCTLCGKGFVTRTIMLNHMKKH